MVLPNIQPGVGKNPHGGYRIHIKLNERQASPLVGGGINLTWTSQNQKGIWCDLKCKLM